jgi:surface polysaccharide O-acyltransferase-like enzyme
MERIESLDTLKGLAILAIIAIHVLEIFIGEGLNISTLDFIFLNTARFGVPLFFLISGYLFKKKIEEKKNEKIYTINYMKKISYYYLIASLIYLFIHTGAVRLSEKFGISLVNNITLKTISYITPSIEFVFNFLYTGTAIKTPLWFFPALLISLGLILIAKNHNKTNHLVFIALSLHIIAILSNSYSLLDLPIPKRDAVFFGLLYTSIGFKIAEIQIENLSNYSKMILGFTSLFFILNIFERMLIGDIGNYSPFFWMDYSFMTIPLSVLILLLGLSKPDLGEFTRFNTYGKYTLWGYIFHPIVIGVLIGVTLGLERLLRISLLGSPVWKFTLIIGTFIITFESIINYREIS